MSHSGGRAFARSEAVRHAHALEESIAARLADVRREAASLDVLEKAVAEFVQEYWAVVGPFFEEHERLSQLCAAPERVTLSAQSTPPSGGLSSKISAQVARAEENANDQAAKQMFRKLAKICHPDFADSAAKSRWFNLLNAAYQERDLAALIRLERELQGDKHAEADPEMRLESLQLEHDAILKMLDGVRLRRHALCCSDAYRLMEQVIRARMQGEDMLVRIRTNLLSGIRTMRESLKVVTVQ